jgi:hypothetical protein
MSGWEVLVIDDSGRFALHVWRYLTGCLGFGIGDVGVDGKWYGPAEEGTAWIAEEPLVSDDGAHRLWWICADDGTLERLASIFGKLDTRCRVYALVDLHGKRGSSYHAGVTYCHLETRGCLIHQVSAYHAGITEEGKTPVLPKSRETLRRMIRELGIAPKDARAPSGVRHILVTGAGFEVRGDHGGFGMPLTRQVLHEMGPPFYDSQGPPSGDPTDIALSPIENAFPIPTSGIWDGATRADVIEGFAQGNLDNYWDVLLGEELQNLLSLAAQVPAQKREARKVRALWRERRLREAFRRSLLRHDWGFMNQCLDAARLPLHAWLTTNYTHFANRAVSLYDDDRSLGMWRIVSTAAEARPLAREDTGAPDQTARYLFKLHGDIAHLQTMAIAGYDKDLFSPLSMPVEDLYEIYAAAERFLIESLREAKELSLVVWHIVGHGLQDRRLCDLLARVWDHTMAEQVFAIVNPQPEGPCQLLRERLAELRRGRAQEIDSCPVKAAQYTARLHRLLKGDDEDFREISQAGKFRQWLAGLKSPP